MKQESQADACLRRTKRVAIAIYVIYLVMLTIASIEAAYGHRYTWLEWGMYAVALAIFIWLIWHSIKSIKKSKQ